MPKITREFRCLSWKWFDAVICPKLTASFLQGRIYDYVFEVLLEKVRFCDDCQTKGMRSIEYATIAQYTIFDSFFKHYQLADFVPSPCGSGKKQYPLILGQAQPLTYMIRGIFFMYLLHCFRECCSQHENTRSMHTLYFLRPNGRLVTPHTHEIGLKWKSPPIWNMYPMLLGETTSVLRGPCLL